MMVAVRAVTRAARRLRLAPVCRQCLPTGRTALVVAGNTHRFQSLAWGIHVLPGSCTLHFPVLIVELQGDALDMSQGKSG
jgi:hypothetical protein